MKVFHGPRKILIRGTDLYSKICNYIKDILENLTDEDLDPLLFVMKCDLFKTEMFQQAWILKIVKSIKENAFRLYGPDITEEIVTFGSVIQCLKKPVPRLGRDHLEYKNSDRLPEIMIQNLG